MPIAFTCPGCGKQYLNIKDSLAGKKIKCKCGLGSRLPELPELPQTPAAPLQAAPLPTSGSQDPDAIFSDSFQPAAAPPHNPAAIAEQSAAAWGAPRRQTEEDDEAEVEEPSRWKLDPKLKKGPKMAMFAGYVGAGYGALMVIGAILLTLTSLSLVSNGDFASISELEVYLGIGQGLLGGILGVSLFGTCLWMANTAKEELADRVRILKPSLSAGLVAAVLVVYALCSAFVGSIIRFVIATNRGKATSAAFSESFLIFALGMIPLVAGLYIAFVCFRRNGHLNPFRLRDEEED